MPEVTRTWILNNLIRPISPDSITDSIDQGLPDDWYGLCNGITVPRGKTPGEAHFLVNALALPSLVGGVISIKCAHENGVTSWPGWYYESHRAVTKQSTPVVWVTFKDSRWLFEDSDVAGDRYNLRASSTAYVEETTNAGTAWTWQGVVNQLWAKLPSAGAAPTLPFTPSSTPENLCFDGIGAWRAVNQVLTAIGCSIVRNPFTNAYTVVQLGTTQAGLSTQLASMPVLWNDRLGMDDLPQEASCLFHYLPAATDYSPFKRKPHVETATIGGTSGTHEIVDTMFYWSGRDAAVATRASEIGQALAGLLAPRANPMSAVFAGVRAITPGSQLTAVRWVSDGTRGFETHVFFEPEPIDWPVLPPYDNASSSGGTIEFVIDYLTTATEGPYTGLSVATVTVTTAPCNRSDLIGTSVEVVDHSGCIFDLTEAELVGVWGWATERVAASLDPEASEGDLTPCHWAADDRCCTDGDL